MTAYLIIDMTVKDAARYEDYKRAVPALIARHGGEYLVRGGQFEVLEGDWKPTRLVLFRFPDRKSINAFFADPDYRPWAELRHAITDSSIVAVDGL